MARRTTSRSSIAASATARITLHDGATGTSEARFSYEPSDPCAVTLTLTDSHGPVPWTFARDLLVDGLYDPIGEGDVHVWPCLSDEGEAVVVIDLNAPVCGFLVEVPSRVVTDFASATLKCVPRGEELDGYDLDGALARLLR